MILQVKKNTIIRDEAASTHHQALLVCLMARGNKSSSSSESDSDYEMPSYDEIVQQNLIMLKFALVDKRNSKN